MLILLTGVSCPLFKYPLILSSLIPSIYRRSAVQIISFLFLPYLVLIGVLCPFAQVLFALSSFASLFNRSAFNLLLPCSSFLTECFQLRSPPLYFFSKWLNLFQGSLVSLVSQRSNLFLPLLFLFCLSLRCHPRSRDEILL